MARKLKRESRKQSASVCVCVPLVVTGILFELFLAGGARDAHWTGTNEDASVASVKSIRDAGLTYLLGRKPT